MLHEQPRQMASPYSKASGQCGDAILVERPGFDQHQCPLDRGPRTLPGRAEGYRFRSATEARPVSSTFRCGCARVEDNVACEWRANPTDRPAIDTGRLDRRKHYTVEGWVAALQSRVTGVEVNHALVVHAKPCSRERAVMIRSENGCYWYIGTFRCDADPIHEYPPARYNGGTVCPFNGETLSFAKFPEWHLQKAASAFRAGGHGLAARLTT